MYKEFKRTEYPEDELTSKYPMYAQLGPYYRTVFTDGISGFMWGYQGTPCASFELNMMNCFEAYGYAKSHHKCRAYLEDFQECISKDKQLKRVRRIQDERDRQYYRGERKTRYADSPKMGSFGLYL